MANLRLLLPTCACCRQNVLPATMTDEWRTAADWLPFDAQQEVQLSAPIQALRFFLQARLSRRIVLWVFASILLIEAVILLPSIYRRQQELLSYLRALSTARVEGALSAIKLANPAGLPAHLSTDFLTQLKMLAPSDVVRGGALYRITGERIDSFGELPHLTFAEVNVNKNAMYYDWATQRYDAAWTMKVLDGRYVLVVRHDTQSVQRELIAFIIRIAGLVTIISIFVTIGTLIGLERILIMPILLLRNDLLTAGRALQDAAPRLQPPLFASLKRRRRDELGEVITAFEQMYQQISDSIAESRQAEKALERLAEIGELAAMIVHEVRNPLTTVMMGLKSFEALDLSEHSRLRLELATAEAERLQRLLNEILHYSRCQMLQAMPLEMNALIEELLESMRAMPAAEGRKIAFTASSPVQVLADRDKLKQVFINLISNACEAISVGETVDWSLRTCDAQRRLCIQIHNGGEPIPSEVLMQITMPFFTTKSSGNGLGLAIVKQIVEAHQGKLEIDSSAKIGGTCVTVSLPYIE